MPEVLALDFQTRLAEAMTATQDYVRLEDPFPDYVRVAGARVRLRVENEWMIATDTTSVTPGAGGWYQAAVQRGKETGGGPAVAHDLTFTDPVDGVVKNRPVDAVVTPNGIAAAAEAFSGSGQMFRPPGRWTFNFDGYPDTTSRPSFDQAGNFTLMPFPLPSGERYIGIGAWLATADAAETARFVIFRYDPVTWLPRYVEVDGGTLTTSPTGPKEVAIDWTVPETGIYFPAIIHTAGNLPYSNHRWASKRAGKQFYPTTLNSEAGRCALGTNGLSLTGALTVGQDIGTAYTLITSYDQIQIGLKRHANG